MTDQTDARHMDKSARDTALTKMATRHRVAQAQERAAFVAALRVAFGRMSAECPGLDGVVQDVTIRQGALAEVLDLAEPGMFLALLEGQGERMGLLMACPVVLAGMVEAQATGRVDKSDVAQRQPTRTDAALLAPMVDAFLRLAQIRCADLPQAPMVSGYGYGSFLDNPRPLGLMLDEGQFNILHLRVSLGFGAKEGDWFIILPDPAQAQQNASDKSGGNDTDSDKDWQDRLQVVIGDSGVVLNSVLCRVQLTLTEALRLRSGDILRLPETALEMLTLESIDQSALAIGRLGQARGQRAVRLTADPGHLSDGTGAVAPSLALPASILWVQPPKPPFTPQTAAGGVEMDGGAQDAQQPLSSADTEQAHDTGHTAP